MVRSAVQHVTGPDLRSCCCQRCRALRRTCRPDAHPTREHMLSMREASRAAGATRATACCHPIFEATFISGGTRSIRLAWEPEASVPCALLPSSKGEQHRYKQAHGHRPPLPRPGSSRKQPDGTECASHRQSQKPSNAHPPPLPAQSRNQTRSPAIAPTTPATVRHSSKRPPPRCRGEASDSEALRLKHRMQTQQRASTTAAASTARHVSQLQQFSPTHTTAALPLHADPSVHFNPSAASTARMRRALERELRPRRSITTASRRPSGVHFSVRAREPFQSPGATK